MATRKRKLSAKEVGKCHPKQSKQSRGRKGGKGRCLPRAILKKLQPVAAECENGLAEHCMLDKIPSTVIPDAEKEQLRKDYLRPRYPNEWLKDEDQWLDNFQIASVMKQYEASCPHFKFIGVVPIDFSAPDPYAKTEKKCMNQEFCLVDLEAEKAAGKTVLGAVFNLDPHYKGGSHWVGLTVDLLRNKVYYFDSYGVKPPMQVARYMRYLHTLEPRLVLESNGRRFQYTDTECGMYSLYFIICMINGDNFTEFCRNPIADKWMRKYRKILFHDA
jgi:hypothetical protein